MTFAPIVRVREKVPSVPHDDKITWWRNVAIVNHEYPITRTTWYLFVSRSFVAIQSEITVPIIVTISFTFTKYIAEGWFPNINQRRTSSSVSYVNTVSSRAISILVTVIGFIFVDPFNCANVSPISVHFDQVALLRWHSFDRRHLSR